MFNKYQIRHSDGTPLKGEKYFVLRLDSDNPEEAARVRAAMEAYKGESLPEVADTSAPKKFEVTDIIVSDPTLNGLGLLGRPKQTRAD